MAMTININHKLIQLSQWTDVNRFNGKQAWIDGDWQLLVDFITRFLPTDRIRHINAIHSQLSEEEQRQQSNVTVKVSFDAMLQLAEEVIGIPQLVIERDLQRLSERQLIVLTYAIYMKHFIEMLSSSTAGQLKLVFDDVPLNNDAIVVCCHFCNEHAFLADRIIIDGRVVCHRRCFKCDKCGRNLRCGIYRRSIHNDDNNRRRYECIEHETRDLIENHQKSQQQQKLAIETCQQPSSVDSSISPLKPPRPSVPPKPVLPLKLAVSSTGDQTQQQSVLSDEIIPTEIQSSGDILPTPVPPPRTKRKSALTALSSSRMIPAGERQSIDIFDYPDFLNPFGSDDDNDEDDVDSGTDYDQSLNPFADSDIDDPRLLTRSVDEIRLSSRHSLVEPSTTLRSNRNSMSPHRQPQLAPATALTLPGHSDRPKSMPPPPPPPSAKQRQPPPHGRIRKKHRAPMPPIPLRRKIMFTDHDISDSMDAVLASMQRLDDEREKSETHALAIEKELLAIMEQYPTEWDQNAKVEQWIDAIEVKCDLVKKESMLVHVYLEIFLNEVHSDIEYKLRCLIEKPESDKSPDDLGYETQLLECLLDIINQKNRLIESQEENAGRRPSSSSSHINQQPTSMTVDATLSAPAVISKRKKLKIRIKKLRRKLIENSTNPKCD